MFYLFGLLFLQGFRTLEDIRTKAHLSATQRIGLKHYNDFLDRMPRDEAAAIEAVVTKLYFYSLLFILFYFYIFSFLSLNFERTKLLFVRNWDPNEKKEYCLKLTEICEKKAPSTQKGLCHPPPALLVDGKNRCFSKKKKRKTHT